ncbi:single-stranded DNA-binding protein [bacterium]|jgi:single-strand DNA-binding protein|nr:single-stranded DNA-binding protein [bacterium]
MASLNRIVLIGRLTSDPEMRTTTNGIVMAKFTLAVDRPTSQPGANATDFIPVIAWRQNAEQAQQQLTKGTLTTVTGRINTRSYDDNQGQRKWVTEVDATELNALERRTQSAPSAPQDVPFPDQAPASFSAAPPQQAYTPAAQTYAPQAPAPAAQTYAPQQAYAPAEPVTDNAPKYNLIEKDAAPVAVSDFKFDDTPTPQLAELEEDVPF